MRVTIKLTESDDKINFSAVDTVMTPSSTRLHRFVRGITGTDKMPPAADLDPGISRNPARGVCAISVDKVNDPRVTIQILDSRGRDFRHAETKSNAGLIENRLSAA